MALYDNYQNAEARLRYDQTNAYPKHRAPSATAPVAAGLTGELAPNFIGGAVNPDTGNLMPGTVQDVSQGHTVTPYGKKAPVKTPAAATSRLASI